MSVDLPGFGPQAVRTTATDRRTDVRPADGARREIREVARAFEGLLLQMLVTEMRKAQVPGGLFGEGAGSHVYEGLFDQFLSEHLTDRAPLGIADLLEEQWSRNLDGVVEAREALREAMDARARDAYGEAAGRGAPGASTDAPVVPEVGDFGAPILPKSNFFKYLAAQVLPPTSDRTVGRKGSPGSGPIPPVHRAGEPGHED